MQMQLYLATGVCGTKVVILFSSTIRTASSDYLTIAFTRCFQNNKFYGDLRKGPEGGGGLQMKMERWVGRER